MAVFPLIVEFEIVEVSRTKIPPPSPAVFTVLSEMVDVLMTKAPSVAEYIPPPPPLVPSVTVFSLIVLPVKFNVPPSLL